MLRIPNFASQVSVPSHPDSASITGAYVVELPDHLTAEHARAGA
jgi:hypothetical protein